MKKHISPLYLSNFILASCFVRSTRMYAGAKLWRNQGFILVVKCVISNNLSFENHCKIAAIKITNHNLFVVAIYGNPL